MSFPKKFLWGAASSAYQIEGAPEEDGKGPSIWDYFCRVEGAILNGDTGDVSCDHYHKYKEDVKLLKDLNIKAYRFSLSWPRILPEGTGKINSAGLGFYDKLVDKLLAADIIPFITLFHWDYPYELYCQGGWLNNDSFLWFGDYAATVTKALSDRVSNWITINEPSIFIGCGYGAGIHAPGLNRPMPELLRCLHNVLKAHGKAVQAIRFNSKTVPSIGYAPSITNRIPLTETIPDIDAAKKATFEISTNHVWQNSIWIDPVILGAYPDHYYESFSGFIPEWPSKDFELISEKIDFLGANVYDGRYVEADDYSPSGYRQIPFSGKTPQTRVGWGLDPKLMNWTMRFLYERYKLPLYVTENGLSNIDWVSVDGKVHDPQRIDFITRYLSELHTAIEAGVDIRGFFHWSLLDNFEWQKGFAERFGLVYTDYDTKARIPKDSAWFYKAIVETNGQNITSFMAK